MALCGPARPLLAASQGAISRGILVLTLALLAVPSPSLAQWRGAIAVEARAYDGDGPAGTRSEELGLVAQGIASWDWDRGRQRLAVEAFLRIDPLESARNRFDLRELNWSMAWDRWVLSAGFREVFWGVAESRHVIDEINQRDPVASLQTYEKLGQPMVSAGAFLDWGSIEVLFLPIFRPRSFRGRSGQLWSHLPVDEDLYELEAGSGRFHPDVAARWSHAFGSWDIGATFFRGLARDPRFETRLVGADSVWAPVYELADRVGIDAQWTTRMWALRVEAATQGSSDRRFLGMAGGVEFAPVDFASLILEYSFDSRGAEATTSYENDVYAGARLISQEGSYQAGFFLDHRSGTVVFAAEIGRRLGDFATITLDGRGFWGDEADEPRHARRLDSYVALRLTHYF